MAFQPAEVLSYVPQNPPSSGVYKRPLPFQVGLRYWKPSAEATKRFLNTSPYVLPEKREIQSIQLLSKEEFLTLLEQDDVIKSAPPLWMHLIQSGVDFFDDQWVANSKFQVPDYIALLRNHHKKTKKVGYGQEELFQVLYYIDRLKAEPGTLDDIYQRWTREDIVRSKALDEAQRLFRWDMNQAHLTFKNDPRSKEAVPLLQELLALEEEELLMRGMNRILNLMQKREQELQENKADEERKLKEEEEERQRIEKERLEAEEQERKERKENEERERRRQQQIAKQQQKEKQKEKKKKALEQADKQVSDAKKEAMDMTKKMAMYQATMLKLSAEMQAGKITMEEYMKGMEEAAKIIQ